MLCSSWLLILCLIPFCDVLESVLDALLGVFLGGFDSLFDSLLVKPKNVDFSCSVFCTTTGTSHVAKSVNISTLARADMFV